MKRLRRILFNTLAAISLLLAIATAGLWVRSEWVCDTWSWYKPQSSPSGGYVESHLGKATIVIAENQDGSRDWPTFKSDHDLQSRSADEYHLTAQAKMRLFLTTPFDYDRRVVSGVVVELFYLRYWLSFLALSAMPTAAGVTLLCRRKRFVAGLCPACGYDKRANAAKCSECGHEVKLAGMVTATLHKQ